MQCLLCFAFTAILGKAPFIPVFWPVLSFLFSPRGCHFLVIAGHGQSCFLSFLHIFSLGARAQLCVLFPPLHFLCPKPLLGRVLGWGVLWSAMDTALLCLSLAVLLCSQHSVWYPLCSRFCPFPLIDIFLGQLVSWITIMVSACGTHWVVPARYFWGSFYNVFLLSSPWARTFSLTCHLSSDWYLPDALWLLNYSRGKNSAPDQEIMTSHSWRDSGPSKSLQRVTSRLGSDSTRNLSCADYCLVLRLQAITYFYFSFSFWTPYTLVISILTTDPQSCPFHSLVLSTPPSTVLFYIGWC